MSRSERTLSHHIQPLSRGIHRNHNGHHQNTTLNQNDYFGRSSQTLPSKSITPMDTDNNNNGYINITTGSSLFNVSVNETLTYSPRYQPSS